MQSGYGEIQQFMVDGSLFSPPPPTNPNAASAEIQHKLYHHLVQPQQQQQQQHHHHHQQQIHQPQPQHHHHHHHHHQTAQTPTMAPQFSHLIHPIPITQQLFHHPHHQFQLFHPPPHHQHHHPHHHHQPQHGLVLDQDSAPQENDPNSPAGNSAVPGPSFLASAMSFKLGVNESSGGGSRDGLNEDDGMLHGDDGSESRLHSWHRDEDSAAANIKEPFWRRPFDIDYINRNNKRPLKDKSPEDNNNNNSTANYSKKSKEDGLMAEHNSQVNQGNPAAIAGDSNYKQLFSELEAIYKPGSGGGGSTPNNNQTGSGSALTGDDNPLLPDTAPCPTAMDHEHCSDTSDGGDAPPPPPLLLSPVLIKKSSHKGGSSSSSGSRRKQRARRRQQEQLRSIAAFIESLVKQVMSHQESLHQKFLDVMERRDKERTSRDEAWRKQEAARSISEASARAQDRALAANREAAIVAFLEKITGERIELPSPLRFLEDQSHKDQDCNTLELYNADICNNAVATNVQLNTSRWPKAEVQALIRVRSGFESRFQEPGLKGPLWEEVSTMMATMGYCRNAKRCKEKWENINKYFRKTKDSGKKRPEHSKTCPYFQQLDQLYSKSSTPPLSSNADGKERKDNSELLDAIVVSNDHQSFQLGSARTEMNGNEDQGNEAGSSAMAGNDHDNEEERDGEEEGEGDSQDQHGHQEQERMERDHQHEEDPQHDTTFFFQRLRS